MAITESFTKSFDHFVTRYGTDGVGRTIITPGWGKDKHYEDICKLLSSLSIVIRSNREEFSERSIINFISTIAIARLVSDPWLATTTHGLIQNYQNQSGCLGYAFSFITDITVEPPLDLVAELQDAILLIQKSSDMQLAVMQKQSDKLTQDNRALREENEQLKQQEKTFSMTARKLEQLKQAQSLIRELNQTMADVLEGDLPTHAPRQQGSPEPAHTCDASPSLPAAPITSSSSTHSPPPPPPALPATMPSQHRNHLWQPSPSSSATENFQSELTRKIKNPNLKKMTAASPPTAGEEEKKNSATFS